MILHLSPEAPALVRAAAATVLTFHIAGGLIGIGSGAAALAFRKGSPAHAVAGNSFVLSMLVMASIGAAVSPFLPQRANVVMGLFVCYLVITGWLTIKRRGARPGTAERACMALAMFAVVIGIAFGLQAAGARNGLLDGGTPWSYWILAGLPTLALVGDLNMFRRGGVSGPHLLARHLWRMGGALSIATVSLFLGQPKVFPAALRDSPLLFLPVVLVLAATVFWLVRMSVLGRKSRAAAANSEPVAI